MDGKILSPFILQTPSVQAQNHKFHPFFSPFFSYFTSIYDLAYNLLQKAQLPSVLLNLHFFILSEIAKVSGVCCYIASEKLVTLKGSHPFSGDKKKFTKLFFFFFFSISAVGEIILHDIWYKNTHDRAFLYVVT